VSLGYEIGDIPPVEGVGIVIVDIQIVVREQQIDVLVPLPGWWSLYHGTEDADVVCAS
jgi:hypothetical protein